MENTRTELNSAARKVSEIKIKVLKPWKYR